MVAKYSDPRWISTQRTSSKTVKHSIWSKPVLYPNWPNLLDVLRGPETGSHCRLVRGWLLLWPRSPTDSAIGQTLEWHHQSIAEAVQLGRSWRFWSKTCGRSLVRVRLQNLQFAPNKDQGHTCVSASTRLSSLRYQSLRRCHVSMWPGDFNSGGTISFGGKLRGIDCASQGNDHRVHQTDDGRSIAIPKMERLTPVPHS